VAQRIAADTPGAGPAPGAIPRPGEVFDPVARGLDLIGERWTLVLVRHLLLGPLGFQELRQRTGIAPRVLSTRLRQLGARGFVEPVREGSRSVYALTALGRTLEPIVAAIARWWVFYAVEARNVGAEQFTETSAQSIVESLPFLLRDDRPSGDVTFELRLTGTGGGVWTVRVEDGAAKVQPGFAEGADVRYTADARVWCGVCLGLIDARDTVKRGLMTKEGGQESLARYFHQIGEPPGRRAAGSAPTRRNRP
jgi:DNA-binding HxlR family transcriptional regulator